MMETPTKSFVHPHPLFIETPRKGFELPVTDPLTETPRRVLVKQTEKAINDYLKDDCETNLPLIRTLEDISYQLWVESNTAFLDESIYSEDEEWQWDEDCFHDSFPSSHTQAKGEDTNSEHCLGNPDLQINEDHVDTESLASSVTSGSSLDSSMCVCDESDCYLGYLGCSELDESVSATEEGKRFESDSFLEEWVVLDNDTDEVTAAKHIDENDWLVLSPLPMSQPIRKEKTDSMDCRKCLDMSENSNSSHNETESTGDTVDSDEVDTEEEWTVLSFLVTEVSEKGLSDRIVYSRDNAREVTDRVSHPTNVTVASASECCQQNKLCFGKMLKSFTHYLVWYLNSGDKQNSDDNKCACCREGSIKNVLTLIGKILVEILKSSYQ